MAKVRDFAIPMDEFHPRPSTAAAFADRKANDFTVDHLATDLKRLDARIASAPDDHHLAVERRRIEGLIAQARIDRESIEKIIQEAKVK